MDRTTISVTFALLLGLAMLAWGISLLIKPEWLHPRTFIYRWIYWRWFALGQDSREEQLSRLQIRYYGLVVTIMGLLAIVGVAALSLFRL
jgi:hypothetical protein